MSEFEAGKKYQFKYDCSPPLIFKGIKEGWYQFYLADDETKKVWSEIRRADLHMIEQLKEKGDE